jgi:hypothetical protein
METRQVEQTAGEKIQAVANLKNHLEEEFIQLGQLLSEIKRSKLFKFKGFKTFREFIEKEFNISSTFANKLIRTFELFIEELKVDEKTAIDIGLDKLNLIIPMLKDSDYGDKDEWLKKAEELQTAELREEIKEVRDRKREKEKNLKDVLVEQHIERMVTYFNCSRKELTFKMALFFQNQDLEEVRETVRENQRKFEETGDI